MFRLQPTKFNAWLNNIGQTFAWRRSYMCPCIEDHSGAANDRCGLCGGRGRIWDQPINGKSGIAGQKVQRGWKEYGYYEDGDVVLTIPSDSPIYDAGEGDRLTMVNSSMPFSTTMTRGLDDVFTLYDVVSIDRVFWKGPNEEVVEGSIPEVQPDGTLVWSGAAPQPGTMFSVTGRKRPDYFMFQDFPQDRAHHGGLDLPRRVVLRKWDLFGRYGNTTSQGPALPPG